MSERYFLTHLKWVEVRHFYQKLGIEKCSTWNKEVGVMVEINVNDRNVHNSNVVNDNLQKMQSMPEELSVLPLRNVLLFPYTVISVAISQPRSIRLLEQLKDPRQLVAIVAYKDIKQVQPDPTQVYQTGCLARILRSELVEERGCTQLLLQGLEKIHIDEWIAEEPFLQAKISKASDIEPEIGDIEAEAVRSNLDQLFKKLVTMISYLPENVVELVSQTKDYRQFAYLISSSIQMDLKQAQAILEQEDVMAKMLKLIDLVNHEIEVFELGKKIQSEARLEMGKAQRDYILREQLKAIRKELGEESDSQIKVEDYRKKIEKTQMSPEAQTQAESELKRLERIPAASSEYNVILTYLDWLISLPWKISTKDLFDIERTREILDEDHFGLETIKRRILEYIAVRQLRQQRSQSTVEPPDIETHLKRVSREGVILCLVGPPGIGKTSLGHSIARSLGRKLQRISLGGVRDEAEIRGHRRTYLGAMPGRFITALRDVGTNNPVILLDEVDKLGSDWHGDPSSALLEVLDPEQNRDFRDHYLEVAFDLSQLMFIATANVLDNIPRPLLDRMEVLNLPGYTDQEKLYIGQNYLMSRQLRENSLKTKELTVTDETMLKVIREYTREAGVRGLDRKLGAICRKVVIKIARNEKSQLVIEPDKLQDYLGKPEYYYDVAERIRVPGVATGLAVTAVGGDILFVEVTSMPGKKNLIITGQLGDVMHESVETALSYVRSRAESLDIDKHFYDKMDLHVHLPAGAIPKDGPSAGVTLVTAMVSLLTHRKVRMDVGMTGEITLRGLVLPVGGIKEKVLAAHRANLKTVILPERNEKDLDDLPSSVKKSMNFVLVNNIDAVIKEVFKE